MDSRLILTLTYHLAILVRTPALVEIDLELQGMAPAYSKLGASSNSLIHHPLGWAGGDSGEAGPDSRGEAGSG